MNYEPITNNQYLAATIALIGQMEGIKPLPYYDTDHVATVGIGFNLEEDNVLRAVMVRMGFSNTEINDNTATGYRQQIVAACNGTPQTDLALQGRLDAIMAARDNANQTGRPTFQLSIPEMELVFNDLRPDYESEISRWNAAINGASADSTERIALFSLGYNQQTNGTQLLGNGLEAAILANDRAEAWFEIRYRSNADALDGIAKRRYIESEFFNIYSDHSDSNVALDEAFEAFRAFSKHENRFLAYDSTYVAGFGATAAEIAAMAGTLNTLGVVVQLNAVEDRYHSLLPAFTKIGDWYQELRDQVKDQLSVAGFTDSDFNRGDIHNAFVAVDVSAGTDTLSGLKETKEHYIDREGKDGTSIDLWSDTNSGQNQGNDATRNNDIIVGSLEANESGDLADVDDILKGGLGNDIIIGGGGGDEMYGGAGNDLLLGGAGADVVEGGDNADAIFGGHGNDTLRGGQGNDRLFDEDSNNNNGGPDNDPVNDIIYGPNGTQVGSNDFDGEEGNDLLRAGSGNDTLQGGKGIDVVIAGKGSDTLTGGSGFDFLIAGEGNDVIHADDDDERDILFGGAGADTFYVGSADIILDINPEDIVYVDGVLAKGRTDYFGDLYSDNLVATFVYGADDDGDGTYGNADRYYFGNGTSTSMLLGTSSLAQAVMVFGVDFELNPDRNQLTASSWEAGSHIAQEIVVEGGLFEFVLWQGIDHHITTYDPIPDFGDPISLSGPSEEEGIALKQMLVQYGYNFETETWNEENLLAAWAAEAGANGNGQGSHADADAGASGSGNGTPSTAGTAAAAAAGAVSSAGSLLSPLVLDLDGNGLELTSLNQSKAYFDLDANGFAQRTGWVTGGDGLLAIDANENGQIDDINELFGAPEPYGTATTNGFDALTALDSNTDDKIDASDAKFGDLRVWIDADEDGLTDAGELKTLGDVGIDSISLSNSESVSQNAGNTVSHVAEFTKTGGGTGGIADVWFANSSFETYSTQAVTVDGSVMALPAVRGYGEIPGLRLAMSQDNGIEDDQNLFRQVQELAFWRSAHDGEVPPDLLNRIEQIVLRWSNVSWEEADSRGPNIDARHLIALERFTGQDFFQSTGPEGPDPGSNAAAALDQAWSDFVLSVGARILMQSVFQPAFSTVTYIWSSDSFGGTLNPAQSVAALAELAPEGSGADAYSFWKLAVSTLDEVAEDLGIAAAQYDQALADALSNVGFGLTLQELRDLDLKTGSGTIIAANEDVTVLGSDAADTVTTGAGDDRIDGGGGNDALNGQAGADTYVLGKDSGQDVVSDLDISAPATDTVQLAAGIAAADVLLVRSGDDLIIRLAGSTASMTVVGQFAGTDAGIERIRFAGGAEWSRANIESLLIAGTAGDDDLTGDSSNNWIDGQTGADTMTGGDGSDTYVVDDEGDVVVEAANGGNDLVDSSVDYVLGDNVEGLVLSGEAVAGTGNVLNNWITGNAENNELDGDEGADLLAGGLGDDTYVVDDAGDKVVEHAEEGTDTVLSSTDWKIVASVENLILTSLDDLDGTGNELDNEITGNNGKNVMSGAAGNDTLNGAAGTDTLDGGSGNDTLSGGSGADQMSGGAGHDTYSVDDLADTIIEDKYKGIDVVHASVDYTLGANLEDLTLTGVTAVSGTGNDANNEIIGNEADNILGGKGGSDTIFGGVGNDTIEGGIGNDTIEGEDGDDTVSGDDGDDTLIGGEGHDALSGGIGEDTLNGDVGNDTLAGGDGIDDLTGGNGNDELDGGVGSDSLSGGAGNDTYVVDDIGDVVAESSGQGTADLVLSSVSYTLTANVERLTLTGTSDIDGTGNSLANFITGNDGANVLDASSGNDTADGGAGNDSVVGGTGNDTLSGQAGIDTLLGGDGNDILLWDADDSIDGGANRDTLVHTGAGAVDVDTAKLSNIEVVNLGAGDDNDNGIILSVQDVLDLASTSSGSGFSKNGDVIDLLIYGDNASATRDNVELDGTWTAAGTFSTSALTGATITFNIYQASGTQVAVQQGLDFTIV